MLKIAIIACCLFCLGCASNNYRDITSQLEQDANKHPLMRSQFLYGKPNGFLDASDWIWPGSLLSKLVLWDRRVDSHQISPETVNYLKDYLYYNQLNYVQVLVNNYRPGNQWSRLFNNKNVAPGWRYTLGILSVAYYTVLPGRFFGGDAYNPYTNTIYLYSDIPGIAIHEGGHAKDTAGRKYKGTHAAIYGLPLAPLYYEARASNDTLSYLNVLNKKNEQKQAYKILHPAYGTYVGGNLLVGVPGATILGAIPGHITGAIAANRVDDSKQNLDN